MAQKGFEYEKKTHSFLLGRRPALTTAADKPAGASSDKPDLIIKYGNKSTSLGRGKYGVELKTDLASAGSLVFHYDRKRKKFDWGDTDNKKEKEFLKELGNQKNVMQTVKQRWRDEPYNQKNRDNNWLELYGHVPLWERYQWDLANFKEIHAVVPSDTIEKYYNLKDTHYLNIGQRYGFFLLGNSDPMELNKDLAKRGKPLIPRWNASNTTSLRMRVHIKGSRGPMKNKGTKDPLGGQGYQFTFELQFKSVTRSPYNIAPIASISKDSVILNTRGAVMPFGKVPS